ncbi:hypothetical protein AVEN_155333-1 [Araneus ventricosus]|uniref:RNase H type-1 domain-containing protein n=1 Tax=Araneus ventricosus TaxID=182803 RepID=A0A4Y2Q5Z0_ARAVE|nr:hypothetical protein AVEN_155333-1 [Araneus ventricosus]
MATKKRKVDSECRAFNEWTWKYFFTVVKDKPVCLICNEAVAVFKEYNISRHFTIAMVESTAINDTAQLVLFIRGVDENFKITEEQACMRSLKGTTKGLLARSIQDSLYNTHNIRLCWIRAHVGHLGNEKADELAKEAITSAEAAVLMVPLPRSSAKQDLKQRELAKWQSRWDDGINGCSTYEIIKKVGHRNHNWSRQLIQFITGHGPFPSYLFRFEKNPDNSCACGEPGTTLHYATKCRLTLFYHLRCPADQHIKAWMKSITNHRLLTNKIIPDSS